MRLLSIFFFTLYLIYLGKIYINLNAKSVTLPLSLSPSLSHTHTHTHFVWIITQLKPCLIQP